MKRELVERIWKLAPLLVLAGLPASANTLEYSADIFSPSGAEMPISSLSLTLSLPKFDTANGTLTNVQLFVYWTDTSNIIVANTDDLSAHTFSGATASIPLTLSGSGFSDLLLTASTNPLASATSTPSFTTAPSGPVAGMSVPQAVTFVGLPCPPGQVCSFNGINAYLGLQNSGQSGTAVFSSNWGLFSTAGFGTFNVNLLGGSPSFSGTELGGGSGHLMFSGDILIGGKVVVIYTFTPAVTQVPEPATLLLLPPQCLRWLGNSSADRG